MGIEVECTPQPLLKLGGKPGGDSRGTDFRVGKKLVEPRAVSELMLSVVLSTSEALAGQQKPTHTHVVSPNCDAQCVVALSEGSIVSTSL